MIDAAAIEALIPHQGAMSLLQCVQSWDAVSIHCQSTNHRAPLHPMARQGSLAAICGVEYAAQAMAVHGALLAQAGVAKAGLLASLRDVACRAMPLDQAGPVLDIRAHRVFAEDAHVIYGFSISCDGGEILSGRAAVVLAAA